MNQRKIVLYIASSLDGYIATNNENMEWLDVIEGEGDNGFSNFYASVDTLLMGRTTYDWIMDHVDEFPYPDKTCYVFSRTKKENTEHVTFIHGDVARFINQLKKGSGKNIWLVGGGDLAASFMSLKLVDEIIVTIAPVLLGDGISLFHPSDSKTSLRLIDSKRMNQFIQLHYKVKG